MQICLQDQRRIYIRVWTRNSNTQHCICVHIFHSSSIHIFAFQNIYFNFPYIFSCLYKNLPLICSFCVDAQLKGHLFALFYQHQKRLNYIWSFQHNILFIQTNEKEKTIFFSKEINLFALDQFHSWLREKEKTKHWLL